MLNIFGDAFWWPLIKKRFRKSWNHFFDYLRLLFKAQIQYNISL